MPDPTPHQVRDFIAAGLRDDPAGGVMLTFPRETERDIYATLAHREAASALRDWYWRDTDRDHFLGMADARNEASLKVLRPSGASAWRTRSTHWAYWAA